MTGDYAMDTRDRVVAAALLTVALEQASIDEVGEDRADLVLRDAELVADVARAHASLRARQLEDGLGPLLDGLGRVAQGRHHAGLFVEHRWEDAPRPLASLARLGRGSVLALHGALGRIWRPPYNGKGGWRAETGVVLEVWSGHPALWWTPVGMLVLGGAAGLLPAFKAYATDVASNLVPDT